MDKDERKPRLHIHMGGLIVLIIILLILFKVDIRSKIKSPQFQSNISYIEEQVKTFWQKYISGPMKKKVGDSFTNITNKELKKIQTNFSENVLKTLNEEEIDNLINGKE
jgi:hypothetical protein